MQTISEREVVKRFNLPDGCCIGCHEDDDEFGYSLCEISIDENTIADVCCVVMRYYKEYKKNL